LLGLGCPKQAFAKIATPFVFNFPAEFGDRNCRPPVQVIMDDWIVTCHPPKFIQEKPAKDSQVSVFQDFEFIASENTDAKTLKVWVNNKALDVLIDKRPSGHYRIVGKLPEPLLQGKAWIKVTSGSNDLRAWNVYIKK
jgi:hypothetical protein